MNTEELKQEIEHLTKKVDTFKYLLVLYKKRNRNLLHILAMANQRHVVIEALGKFRTTVLTSIGKNTNMKLKQRVHEANDTFKFETKEEVFYPSKEI